MTRKTLALIAASVISTICIAQTASAITVNIVNDSDTKIYQITLFDNDGWFSDSSLSQATDLSPRGSLTYTINAKNLSYPSIYFSGHGFSSYNCIIDASSHPTLHITTHQITPCHGLGILGVICCGTETAIDTHWDNCLA